MPAVFVHGNPETAVIWEPLLAELGRKGTICLSPPGFGSPVPAGFGSTRLEYGDWLIRGWRRSVSRSISWATTGEAGTCCT